MSLSLFLFTALVLGMRHSLDPDHLVAVSTLVAEERRLWPAARLGLFWGIGHLLPITIIGLPVLLLGLELPETMEHVVDLGVGILLIALGCLALWRLRKERIHFHVHTHDDHAHAHFHTHDHAPKKEHVHAAHSHPHGSQSPDAKRRNWMTFGIGMIHGLAGSAGVAVLALEAAPNLSSGVGYLLLFGLGTCLGMFAMTLCVAAPAFTTLSRFSAANHMIRGLAGSLSILVGVMLWVEILPQLR